MSGAMRWMDIMDRVLMGMKGRPFSGKQRNAIMGVLLTIDPESPFYAQPSDEPRYTITEAGREHLDGKAGGE